MLCKSNCTGLKFQISFRKRATHYRALLRNMTNKMDILTIQIAAQHAMQSHCTLPKLQVSLRKRATHYRALLRKTKAENNKVNIFTSRLAAQYVAGLFSQKSHTLLGSFAENIQQGRHPQKLTRCSICYAKALYRSGKDA